MSHILRVPLRSSYGWTLPTGQGVIRFFLLFFISRSNSLRRTLSEVAGRAGIQDRQRGQAKEDWLAAVTGSSVQCVCSCKLHGPLFLQPDTCVTLGTLSACRWRHYVVASGGGSPSAGSRCIVFASSEPTEESLKGRWTSPPTLKFTRRGRCSPTWACKHEDDAHHVQKNQSVPGGTAVTHMWVDMLVTEGGFNVAVSFI